MRLNKSNIDAIIPPEKGQTIYRDDLLVGFGLRVTTKGTKSFIVEKAINGRPRRVTLGRYGHLTVEQARKQAQKYLGQVAVGIDPQAHDREQRLRSITLERVVADYLQVRKNLSPRTVQDYHRVMREGFPDWQKRPLCQISKDAISSRHRRLGERGHARANNAMRVLRALFYFAQGQYEDAKGASLFPENPVSRLSHTRAWYPNVRRKTVIRRSALPVWFEAVKALKEEPGNEDAHTVADFLLLLVFTGMRRTEGLTLKWEYVDFAEKTLLIPQTKNGEPLHLPMSTFIYSLLKQRAEISTSEYVFQGTGETGHLVEPRKQMNKVIKRTGVKFTLHDLRRTFITIAESLEISMYSIKRLVNHKMGNDVTAGYIIPDAERLRAPMQKITDFLLSLMNLPPDHNVIDLKKKGLAHRVR